MDLISKLESVLFVAGKPLKISKIAKVLGKEKDELIELVAELEKKYDPESSGVVLLKNNEEWQMVSNPNNREEAENFLKAENAGDLTRPQLETLTVISYRGPITKPELEQIRGVNCALILRNLLIRGLIKESDDRAAVLPKYEITLDYLKQLGIESPEQLPEYEEIRDHAYLEEAQKNQN